MVSYEKKWSEAGARVGFGNAKSRLETLDGCFPEEMHPCLQIMFPSSRTLCSMRCNHRASCAAFDMSLRREREKGIMESLLRGYAPGMPNPTPPGSKRDRFLRRIPKKSALQETINLLQTKNQWTVPLCTLECRVHEPCTHGEHVDTAISSKP